MHHPHAGVSRREFIRTLAAGAAAVAGGATWLRGQTNPLGDNLVTLSILHTTDLHSHILPTTDYSGNADLGGFARVATQIARWRAENPNSILIDAGDLYQGHPTGYHSRGRLMVDCANALRYDAWVVGNHEFDWGVDVLCDAVKRSRMPVLAANARLQPALAARLPIAPFTIRTVAGFKVAIIGVTTPGLPFWLPESLLGGFHATDPIEAVRAALLEVRSQRADLIILAAHMGVRDQGDDFANRISRLAVEFPQVSILIGAHTHRMVPVQIVGKVLYTQANFHGIHVGRVDIMMDRRTRRPVHVEPRMARMTADIPMDPEVLSLAAPVIEEVDREMATSVGSLAVELTTRSEIGVPSGVERLYGAAIRTALAKAGERVDAVFHGTFGRAPEAPGAKTVRDIWRIAPYENYIVLSSLSRAEIVGVLQEMLDQGVQGGSRNFLGLRVRIKRDGDRPRVDDVRLADGTPLERERRYRVAMNSYDAQSAGRSLLMLRAIVEQPAARTSTHSLQTREALVAFFRDAGEVGQAQIVWPGETS